MPTDDTYEMNLRASLALRGVSPDWRRDLANLMRSDVPLERWLRDRLADAFENESQTGPRLDLKNQKAGHDKFVGVMSRDEWMSIGHWIEAQRASGLANSESIEGAAKHFRVSAKKVEKALTYYNKAKIWVDQAMRSEAGQAIGREYLEKLYHAITVRPEIRRLNADLIREMGLSH